MGIHQRVLKFYRRLTSYFANYVSPKIIFAIDLFTSLVSSGIVILVGSYSTRELDMPLYGSARFAVIWLCASLFATIAAITLTRANRIIIRHSSLRDLYRVVLGIIIKMLIMAVITIIAFGPRLGVYVALVCDCLVTMVLTLITRISMILIYDVCNERSMEGKAKRNVLVYGCSDKAVSIITRLQNSPHYKVVGFLVDDKSGLKESRLADLPVHHITTNDQIILLAKRICVKYVMFPTENDARDNDELIRICATNNIKALVVPTVEEVVSGKIMKSKVREVKIEDLLGRDEILIAMDNIIANFCSKTVLVTGAAGSIGSELCRQLASFGVSRLILFDNAETPLHNLRLELEERFPHLDLKPIIGDVRHIQRLDFAFRAYRPEVVFHAAAYKHVPLMEENPCEAVLVNVHGTRNVADKCLEYGVEKMVMVSTDKAVNPTNIMGCTKRLAEIYVQSLGLAVRSGQHNGKTSFVTTRFGNVLGSNGSVIPRFREQIQHGGPVTVTHPEINRFFMTIPEACKLVMEAATMSTDNQIYVFDMGEPIKIADLAKRMIELAGLRLGEDIEIEYTGLRPGEKLYEEVLSNKENTEPTSHDRIRVAKVREYDYANALDAVDNLMQLAYQVNIPEMVMLMKRTIPEFKSKNSPYEKYDFAQ